MIYFFPPICVRYILGFASVLNTKTIQWSLLIIDTFRTVMMPSCVSFCVTMSNISVPSPSIILYSISAFFPVSASVALTLPMAVPTGDDSGMRRWMVSEIEKKRNKLRDAQPLLEIVHHDSL